MDVGWVNALSRCGIIAKKWMGVCSQHFLEEEFYYEIRKEVPTRFITKGKIPTKMMPELPLEQQSLPASEQFITYNKLSDQDKLYSVNAESTQLCTDIKHNNTDDFNTTNKNKATEIINNGLHELKVIETVTQTEQFVYNGNSSKNIDEFYAAKNCKSTNIMNNFADELKEENKVTKETEKPIKPGDLVWAYLKGWYPGKYLNTIFIKITICCMYIICCI